MLTVYLLRHGQTAWNAANKYLGRTDIPLTETGIRQAQDAGRQLAGIRLDAVYASPLERARHTAEIAGGGLLVATDERLIETDFGKWEGMTKEETFHDDSVLASSWENDPANTRAGATGDSATDVVKRATSFFNDLHKAWPNGHVLVVAHNGVNRFYLTHKLGMPLKNYHQIIQEHSAVTRFTLDDDGVLTLHELNSRVVDK